MSDPDQRFEDDVLRRMLATPPSLHKPEAAKDVAKPSHGAKGFGKAKL